MSVVDRLAEIERQSVDASEQWDCGRSAFNADNHAPPIDDALANGDLMLAALRAVLEVCERELAEPWSPQTEHLARTARTAITNSLGEVPRG